MPVSTKSEKIRVLHPITRLIIGGAQENTMLTAELLDKEAWDVDVYCGPQTGTEGSLIEIVQERGISLTIEPTMVREINPIKDLMAFVRLTRFIKRNGYQIVHTHSSKAGIVGRWAAKMAGAPIIVHTVHGWGHHERQHPLVRALYIVLEKLTLPITDKLIVVSPRNIDKGLADGIGKADDYVVIRSGIELDRFGHPQVSREEMRRDLGIPQDAVVIGTVTRLSPQKAPLDFLQMVAALMARDWGDKQPNLYFVMVGDGPLRGDVEATARELGVADRVVLTGLRRDIPELMATFDIFALSSLWEGLPRVLPQAMAAGLPIVATKIDGTAEAVQHGVNGYLSSPGKPIELANAIADLVADSALAKQMGAAGRENVAEFGARRMVDQIDQLYRDLLARKGGSCGKNGVKSESG